MNGRTNSYECRDLRHAWEHTNDVLGETKGGDLKSFDRHLVCMRCRVERIDTFLVGARWIAKQKSRYKYPEGYHIKGGISLPEVRYALFADMLKKKGRAAS